MSQYVSVHGLKVAPELHSFINQEVLPGTGVDPAAFWKGFDAIVHDLAPKNAALLAERDRLQADLDAWLIFYNTVRTHQGKMCCGRTPMETLEDGKKLWQDKNLNQI